MKKDAPEITYEELIQLVSYNKHTGSLTWQVNRSRLAKTGDEAGSLSHNGTVMIGLQGRTYAAPQIIWLYVTGAWPRGRIKLADGDPTNLRWNNLLEANATLSTRHSAVYQRARRRIVKIAKQRIAEDPSLLRMYTAPTNAGERHILQKIAAEVEDDMHRNMIDPANRPVSVSRAPRKQRARTYTPKARTS